MRIPKVGEKWTRHDGKKNNITVTGIDAKAGGSTASIVVRYRYDDGLDSSKTLPEFHKKFKDAVPVVVICSAVHTTLGVPCARPKDHEGAHATHDGMHSWEVKKKAVPEKPTEPKPETPSPKATPLSDSRRVFIQTYYGYDGYNADPSSPKEGNWDNAEYRARYCGLKK